MHRTLAKTGLIALATVLTVTGALAQEARRGNGNRDQTAQTGQRSGDQARTGTRSGQNGGSTTVTTTTPRATETAGNSWLGGWGGNATPGIDRRQAEQDRLIERGQRTGTLTRSEAAQLKAEQARIAELERRAKADGIVTRDERLQIRTAQQQAERHIYEESADREREGGRRHGGWWGRGWAGSWGWGR